MTELMVYNAIARGNKMEWLTATGLNPNVVNASNPLSAEDEEMLALHLSGIGDSVAWARGDLGLYIREKCKRQIDQRGLGRDEFNQLWGQEIERLAKLLGCSPKTLYNNITTCSNWPIEARRNTLAVRYKHHEVLPNSMPLADRIRMIEQADSEGWNYKRFYAVVHGHVLPDTSEPTDTYQAPAPTEDDDPFAPTDGRWLNAADFLGNESPNASPDTYESIDFSGSQDTSGGPANGASWDVGMHTVSLHIVSNSGVDLVVDNSTEAQKFVYAFSNGSMWEVVPDLTNGSLVIRKLDTTGA
jgi:hypothetical protein